MGKGMPKEKYKGSFTVVSIPVLRLTLGNKVFFLVAGLREAATLADVYDPKIPARALRILAWARDKYRSIHLVPFMFLEQESREAFPMKMSMHMLGYAFPETYFNRKVPVGFLVVLVGYPSGHRRTIEASGYLESRIMKGYVHAKPIDDGLLYLEELKIGPRKFTRLWRPENQHAPFIESGSRLIKELRGASRKTYSHGASHTERHDLDISGFLY
jgi:hypothetical protein